jgi:hypothetical protein
MHLLVSHEYKKLIVFAQITDFLSTTTYIQMDYSSVPASTSNMFQDLPQLRETADNTKRYIYCDIHVIYINTVKFN